MLMKKLLLLFAAVFTAAISMTAQTGSLVREDRVWTQGGYHYHHEKYFENWYEIDNYRFDGSCVKNGKTYMILLNEGNEYIEGNQQVALMRQEGGKVYLCVDEKVKEYLNYFDSGIDLFWNEEGKELWTKYSKDFEEEILIYDFDAKPGDKYISFSVPMIISGNWDGAILGPLEIEVLDCYTINVNGTDYRCQAVRNNLDLYDEYIIVEGIGCNIGTLFSPMLIYPRTTGYTDTDPIMYRVSDTSGNTLFEYKDFVTDHVGIPWLRRWEYIFADKDGNRVNMTLYHTTNGGLTPDCLKYNEIKWSYTIDEQTGELMYNNDKSVSSEYMEGFKNVTSKDGKLYMTITDEMREYLQYDGDAQVMLYDFNAKPGDKYNTFKMEQILGENPFNPTFEEVNVLETGYIEVEHENCRIHKISYGGREDSIIEGFGSVETGLLPYSNVYDPSNGSYSGFRLNRVFNFITNSKDEHIIYRHPNYIDVNDLGNTDAVKALFGDKLGLMSYDRSKIGANGLSIAVYDMSGKIVAEGCGEVSTESLQPGVYVAKSGAQTLKILVK